MLLQMKSTSYDHWQINEHAGFTLLEMLVVLAILGLGTSWIAVRASGFFGGGVGMAVADARRALVNCRRQAQVEGLPVLCKVDPVEGRIGSTSLKGKLSRLDLIGGTGDGSVLFYPSGEASAARIIIGNDTEENHLEISAITGRVRVLDDH